MRDTRRKRRSCATADGLGDLRPRRFAGYGCVHRSAVVERVAAAVMASGLVLLPLALLADFGRLFAFATVRRGCAGDAAGAASPPRPAERRAAELPHATNGKPAGRLSHRLPPWSAVTTGRQSFPHARPSYRIGVLVAGSSAGRRALQRRLMATGKKIAVCTGAGGYAGAHMVKAGEDVTFIDFWPRACRTHEKHGLTITHLKMQAVTVPTRALRDRIAAIGEGKPFDTPVAPSRDTAWATVMISASGAGRVCRRCRIA